MSKNLFFVVIFSLLLAESAALAQTLPEKLPQPEEKIHYGDIIDVDIIGSTEYDWRGIITPEGFIGGLDFVESPIYALCQTEADVARQIEKGYEKLLRQPQVVVKILDRSGRPLSMIYGAIKTPQRFRIERPAKLNELIILSGGLTEQAGGNIQILRPRQLNCDAETKKSEKNVTIVGGNRERFVSTRTESGSTLINIRIQDLLSGKPDSNPQIFSGDIVTILEADPVFVMGGVAKPTKIALRSQLTLTRAVSSAGGLLKEADEKKIVVFRRDKTANSVIEINFEDIKNGKAEDLVLKPFDVIEVSMKGKDRRKFPPVLRMSESSTASAPNLPLRIID